MSPVVPTEAPGKLYLVSGRPSSVAGRRASSFGSNIVVSASTTRAWSTTVDEAMRTTVPVTMTVTARSARNGSFGQRNVRTARPPIVPGVTLPPGFSATLALTKSSARSWAATPRSRSAMTEIWPDYVGCPRDGLRIEVFETWLERI